MSQKGRVLSGPDREQREKVERPIDTGTGTLKRNGE